MSSVVCLIVILFFGLIKLRGVEVCLLCYVWKEIVVNIILLNVKFLNYCMWIFYWNVLYVIENFYEY